MFAATDPEYTGCPSRRSNAMLRHGFVTINSRDGVLPRNPNDAQAQHSRRHASERSANLVQVLGDDGSVANRTTRSTMVCLVRGRPQRARRSAMDAGLKSLRRSYRSVVRPHRRAQTRSDCPKLRPLGAMQVLKSKMLAHRSSLRPLRGQSNRTESCAYWTFVSTIPPALTSIVSIRGRPSTVRSYQCPGYVPPSTVPSNSPAHARD